MMQTCFLWSDTKSHTYQHKVCAGVRGRRDMTSFSPQVCGDTSSEVRVSELSAHSFTAGILQLTMNCLWNGDNHDALFSGSF